MHVVPSSSDLHGSITQQIVAAIAQGAGEFVMPWHSCGAPPARPINAATQLAYHGVNTLALWACAVSAGYPTGSWATYRQWTSLGAQVRRGERGAMIVFYKPVSRDDDPTDSATVGAEHSKRWLARASYVFNAAQVDGWRSPEPGSGVTVLGDVEAFVTSTGAQIDRNADVACYLRSADLVMIPPCGRFVGSPTSSPTEAYYATLLHELVHWTGAEHRLDRRYGARFGDEAYAFEELVAELGAAFLCADLGVTNAPRRDHAAYVEGWLEILGNDSWAIFTAARLAAAATGLLTASAPAPNS